MNNVFDFEGETPQKKKDVRLSVDQQIQTDFHDFAMYTLEQRALPSMIDGFKPAQRKAIYSGLKLCKNARVKTNALVGQTLMDGYVHGDGSMAGTISGMAAVYANNYCFFDGEGNFGNRFEQEPSAARYTSVKVAKHFHELYKDFDILKTSGDPENPEPIWYLPLVPTVLLNGVDGIAYGFATTIQRHKLSDLVSVCSKLAEGQEVDERKELKPWFHNFKGKIRWNKEELKWQAVGTWKQTSKTTMEITEIPLKWERSKYIKRLDELEEKGKISSYVDMSSQGNYRFIVKFKRDMIPTTNVDDYINKMFGLVLNLNENITVLDEKGAVKIYATSLDLCKDFVTFRMKTVRQRLDWLMADQTEQLKFLYVKREFIQEVINKEINFRGQSRQELKMVMIKDLHGATMGYVDRLLAMQVHSFTKEKIEELNEEIEAGRANLKTLTATTPAMAYEADLAKLGA